jgi:putative redox protein
MTPKELLLLAVEAAKAIEAVQLSQTKYCGVSAMVAASVPIHYTIEINEKKVGTGQARFS